MKLALVRQRYNPYGGAERFIERAVAALEREGAEVALIAREWRGQARRVLEVNPFYIGRWWRDAGFARAARAAWERAGFSLVQSHERIPGASVYRAGDGVHGQWLEHRARYAPMPERVSIALNPYHSYVCAAEKAMFEHPALRAVICNSNMVRGEILRHFSIAEDKLHVIYNGVDLEHFHPHQRQRLRQQARAQIGAAERCHLLLFAGSGFARKGLATVLRALAASADRALRLAIAGVDRSQPKFERLAASLGLGDRVAFLGGQDDMRRCYAAADLLVLPTLYDPFPNVVLEAMAMGVPVIISNQCGAAELITHSANGWVCAPQDPQRLAEVIQQAREPEAARRVGAAARRSVEPLGLQVMAAALLALYRRLA